MQTQYVFRLLQEDGVYFQKWESEPRERRRRDRHLLLGMKSTAGWMRRLLPWCQSVSYELWLNEWFLGVFSSPQRVLFVVIVFICVSIFLNHCECECLCCCVVCSDDCVLCVDIASVCSLFCLECSSWIWPFTQWTCRMKQESNGHPGIERYSTSKNLTNNSITHTYRDNQNV